MLAKLLMVELLFILVELVSGAYMVFVGVDPIGIGVHGAFGVLSGILGIIIAFYAYRATQLNVGTQCLLGLIFVVVAGVGGILYVKGLSPTQAYSGLMAVGFIGSGALYSMALPRLRRKPHQ
jgi:hypothetical protein